MKRRVWAVLLTVLMLAELLPAQALALEETASLQTTEENWGDGEDWENWEDEDAWWGPYHEDDSGVCGDALTYSFVGSTGTLTITGSGAMYDFNYENPAPWEDYKDCFGTLVLGAGIETIGNEAFHGCYYLSEVELPDGVGSIGEDAFSDCQNLSRVVIPGSVRAIGDHAFDDCRNLTDLEIPYGVESIGSYAFSRCALTSLTVPESVTNIDSTAFYYCRSLVSAYLPASMTGSAPEFYGCDSLVSIQVAEGNPNYMSIDGVLYYARNGNPVELISWPCAKKGALVIPDTVRQINGLACYGSSGLTSVTIPAYTRMMGYGPFASSTALTAIQVSPDNPNWASLDGVLFSKDLSALYQFPSGRTGSYTVPSSVKTLNEIPFESCSLTEVVIPDTVGLGANAYSDFSFSNSPNLTSVRLPSSLTETAYDMFYDCPSLTEVNFLPEGITTIGWSAFGNDHNLRSVTIPANVTTIGSLAFVDCANLTTVRFQGGPPTSIDANAFRRCAKGQTLYFYYPRDRAAEWANFSYTGNEVTVKLLPWGSVDTESLSKNLTKGQYAIYVLNAKGEAVEGATVTYSDKNSTTDKPGITDKSGMAVFTRQNHTGEEVPTVTVTKEGYLDYKEEAKGKIHETVILYTEEDSPLKLKTAEYSFFEDFILPQNILSGYKRVSNSKSFDGGIFYLRVRAHDTSEVDQYTLVQGGKILYTSQDGEFKVDVGDLSVGKGFQVYTRGKDGKEIHTDINLEILADKAQDTSFKIGNKASFTVEDDMPFFGGSELTLDIPDLPVEVYVDDDTVHIGINAAIRKKDRKSTQEQLDELKDTVNALKRLNGVKVGKGMKDQLSSIMKEEKAFEMPVGVKTKVNFIGYGEGKLNSAGNATVTIYLCLMVDVSKTIQGPTYMVVVVPMTYSIKVGVEVKGEAEFSYEFGGAGFRGEVGLVIKPNAEVFGGVGVGQVIGGGAYGSAEVPFEIQLLSTELSPGLNYVDLTGEMGLKAYVGGLEYKKSWAHHTWNLYTRKEWATLQSLEEPYEGDGVGSIDDISNWTPADLSYLKSQSGWLGGGVSLLSTDGSLDFVPLLDNTYRNARPTLVMAGSDPVMVWLSADPAREDCNATQVLYSVNWQEPQVLAADGTADFAPAAASDGTNVWMVYQNSDSPLSSADPQVYTAAQTIAVSSFSGSSFSQPVTLYSEGYNFLPRIAVVGGVPTAVWVNNINTSDIFGANDTNRILYAQYVDGDWTEAAVLAEGLNAVTDLAVGLLGDEIAAAWITDRGNDLATANDRTLTCRTLSGAAVFQDTGMITSPVFAVLPGDTASTLLWYADGKLLQYDGTAAETVLEEAENLQGGFTVLSDRIVVNNATQSASELFAYIYDGTTWSGPVQMTEQNCYLQSYSLAERYGRIYAAAVQTSVVITEDAVEDRCTLIHATLGGKTDVGVSYVTYQQSAVQPKANLPVSVGLVNNGDTGVGGVLVTITDADGNAVTSEDVYAGLAPGAEGEVQVGLPLGSDFTLSDYIVTVTALGDGNSFNDTAALRLGYADLSVSSEMNQVGGTSFLLVSVTNEGCAPAACTLEVYAPDCPVPTAAAETTTLAAGETELVRIAVSSELLAGASEGVLTLRAVSNDEELNTMNNASLQYVDLRSLVRYDANGGTGAPAAQEILPGEAMTLTTEEPVWNGHRFLGWAETAEAAEAAYAPGASVTFQGDVTLYAVWETFTGDAVAITGLSGGKAAVTVTASAPALLVAAAYDGDGMLLDKAVLEVPSGTDRPVELPLTVTNLPGGGQVKAFLLRKYDQTVLCDAAVYGK